MYLCICTEDNRRAECFSYDNNLDQCSQCLAQGRCIKGNLRNKNDFLCLCPRCHNGPMCQFNNEQLGFTLDFLVVESTSVIQYVAVSVVALMFLLGALTNTASFITFRRPMLRKTGVPNYLLAFSLVSQCSLFALQLKTFHIVFGHCSNHIICKLLSYFLSITTRSSHWLTSWVTVERVYMVVFPFGTLLRKPRLALRISLTTIIVTAALHTIELMTYISITDMFGKSVCTTSMSSTVAAYSRINVFVHYFAPFCIQIVSISFLILFAARSRSRTNHRQKSFVQHLKSQFKNQKELYITPIIIILSGMPQIILSFHFACSDLSAWRRHALLTTYFISYSPQLLGFMLFVLPSTHYFAEFRQTSLARTRLFRSFLEK